MPKKTRVRTFMESQCVERSETLLKYAWQYFCQFFYNFEKRSAREVVP